MIKILYEDNHIIAVVKPAGVLTQGDRSEDVSLYDMVKDYIRIKKGKGSLLEPRNARPVEFREANHSTGVFLGLVHRLDKPVQGIVLFGKTSKGASRLSEQFRNHTIQKTYHGIVIGKLDKQKGEIKEKVNKISFFAEGFTNKTDEELLAEIKKAIKTRTAELSWEVVKYVEKSFDKAQGGYSLIKIMPKTGRFHQIRIQMANMGHPILGDTKYGKQYHRPIGGTNLLCDKQTRGLVHGSNLFCYKLCGKEGIALCATAISFKTATEEKQIDLKIDMPEEWKKII